MDNEKKKLEGFISGYQKYKTKYSLMVRFAEKRLLPEIEGLKVKRQILVDCKLRYDADKWNIIYSNVCDRLKHLENLYDELHTIMEV